ncbi:hypothetical protein GCM10010495_21910 [Kitasatospora herbaricolor]|nr:hypothetical protein GCM10010495_21910 [Kitasatospora herbaricolor]
MIGTPAIMASSPAQNGRVRRQLRNRSRNRVKRFSPSDHASAVALDMMQLLDDVNEVGKIGDAAGSGV